ncbi:uncharacterized protein B0H18DRAFT_32911 [Fomitopsis serialis]|uniref:uncharacterized protein n=1 Tax=Fomitopsis serialis TaxID=139415 RepID=UPI00200826E4|nr:uncharacterized protein B0H18DRAFT_32911 [Neoantrodia serialis]KAH9932631.1 hypothetical protein B0H18DRAFT_32911 [Neoantrodia serialis]
MLLVFSRLSIAAMSAAIVADTVVLLSPGAAPTISMTRLARSPGEDRGISKCAYISRWLLLIMNSVGLATYLPKYFSSITSLTAAFSTIILSHLLLNL